MSGKTLFALVVFFLSITLENQGFAQINVFPVQVLNIPELRSSSMDVIDMDFDGDLDLIISGVRPSGFPQTNILEFVELRIGSSGRPVSAIFKDLRENILGIRDGVVRWIDYDADGDFDVLISGLTHTLGASDVNDLYPFTHIYTNTGNAWVPTGNLALISLGPSVIDIRDMDGNGFPDIVLGGRHVSGVLTIIYMNENGRFDQSGPSLPGIEFGTLQTGDIDNDGDYDILFSGMNGSIPRSFVALNDGNESFTFSDYGLPQQYLSRMAWADFDVDGDLDVAVTGGVLAPDLLRGISSVWRNEGDHFIPFDVSLKGIFAGNPIWGDFEGDGDLDLLISGLTSVEDPESETVQIYLNENGVFSNAASFRGVSLGSTVWRDYNRDGTLDVLMIGYRDQYFTAQLMLLELEN